MKPQMTDQNSNFVLKQSGDLVSKPSEATVTINNFLASSWRICEWAREELWQLHHLISWHLATLPSAYLPLFSPHPSTFCTLHDSAESDSTTGSVRQSVCSLVRKASRCWARNHICHIPRGTGVNQTKPDTDLYAIRQSVSTASPNIRKTKTLICCKHQQPWVTISWAAVWLFVEKSSTKQKVGGLTPSPYWTYVQVSKSLGKTLTHRALVKMY